MCVISNFNYLYNLFDMKGELINNILQYVYFKGRPRYIISRSFPTPNTMAPIITSPNIIESLFGRVGGLSIKTYWLYGNYLFKYAEVSIKPKLSGIALLIYNQAYFSSNPRLWIAIHSPKNGYIAMDICNAAYANLKWDYDYSYAYEIIVNKAARFKNEPSFNNVINGLIGGNNDLIVHIFTGYNSHTEGIPNEGSSATRPNYLIQRIGAVPQLNSQFVRNLPYNGWGYFGTGTNSSELSIELLNRLLHNEYLNSNGLASPMQRYMLILSRYLIFNSEHQNYIQNVQDYLTGRNRTEDSINYLVSHFSSYYHSRGIALGICDTALQQYISDLNRDFLDNITKSLGWLNSLRVDMGLIPLVYIPNNRLHLNEVILLSRMLNLYHRGVALIQQPYYSREIVNDGLNLVRNLHNMLNEFVMTGEPSNLGPYGPWLSELRQNIRGASDSINNARDIEGVISSLRLIMQNLYSLLWYDQQALSASQVVEGVRPALEGPEDNIYAEVLEDNQENYNRLEGSLGLPQPDNTLGSDIGQPTTFTNLANYIEQERARILNSRQQDGYTNRIVTFSNINMYPSSRKNLAIRSHMWPTMLEFLKRSGCPEALKYRIRPGNVSMIKITDDLIGNIRTANFSPEEDIHGVLCEEENTREGRINNEVTQNTEIQEPSLPIQYSANLPPEEGIYGISSDDEDTEGRINNAVTQNTEIQEPSLPIQNSANFSPEDDIYGISSDDEDTRP